MQKIITAQKMQEEVSKPKSKRPPQTNLNKMKSASGLTKKEDGIKQMKEKDKSKKLSTDGLSSDGAKVRPKKEGKKKKEKRDKEHKEHKEHKDHKDHKEHKEHKKDKVKKEKKHSEGGEDSKAIEFNDDLDPSIFIECKERMRPVKKSLKMIGKSSGNLTKSEQKNHLITIGNRIKQCLEEECQGDISKSKEWRNYLWTFVSKFTEFPAKKLYKLYKHALKSNHHPDDSNRDRHSDKNSFNHGQSTSHSSQSKRPSSSSYNMPNKRPKENYNSMSNSNASNHSNEFSNAPPPSPSAQHSIYQWNSRSGNYEKERFDRYNKSSFRRDGGGDTADRKFSRFQNDRPRFRNNVYNQSRNIPYHKSHFPSNENVSSHNFDWPSHSNYYNQWSGSSHSSLSSQRELHNRIDNYRPEEKQVQNR